MKKKLLNVLEGIISGILFGVFWYFIIDDSMGGAFAMGCVMAIVAGAKAVGQSLGTPQEWTEIGDNISMIGAPRREQAMYNQMRRNGEK